MRSAPHWLNHCNWRFAKTFGSVNSTRLLRLYKKHVAKNFNKHLACKITKQNDATHHYQYTPGPEDPYTLWSLNRPYIWWIQSNPYSEMMLLLFDSMVYTLDSSAFTRRCMWCMIVDSEWVILSCMYISPLLIFPQVLRWIECDEPMLIYIPEGSTRLRHYLRVKINTTTVTIKICTYFSK